MESREVGMRVLIGGDFNARTGEKEGGVGNKEGEGQEMRKSRDKVINGEGRKLCSFLDELGWGILNGNMEGDEKGKWTFTRGRGGSIIDYVVENEETREEVRKLRVRERMDSKRYGWEGREVQEEVKGREREEEGKRCGRKREKKDFENVLEKEEKREKS